MRVQWTVFCTRVGASGATRSGCRDCSRQSRAGGPRRERGDVVCQGVVRAASAVVHAQRGTPRGIVAQLLKAERTLAGYRPYYLGVDVDGVLAHAARCRELVERRRDEEPRSWLGVADVPRLELDTRPVRGDEPALRRGEGDAPRRALPVRRLPPGDAGGAGKAPARMRAAASLSFARTGKPNRHALHDVGLA